MLSPNIPTAFLFGLLSFFSPCTLPLLPSFLSFLAGVSVKELEDPIYTKQHRNRILMHVLLYVLGACFVLVLLGVSAGSIGYIFRTYSFLLQQVGGIVVILFGIWILDIIHTPFFNHSLISTSWQKIIGLKNTYPQMSFVISFLLGIIFTLGWVPCLSPILGGILILAAHSANGFYGGLLLLLYAFGEFLPFILFALFVSNFLGYIVVFRKYIKGISVIAGVLLIILGIFLLLGSIHILSGYVYILGEKIFF